MIGWLWRVIFGRFGCDHKWASLHTVAVYNHSMSREIPFAYDISLQCDKCGNIKKVRT